MDGTSSHTYSFEKVSPFPHRVSLAILKMKSANPVQFQPDAAFRRRWEDMLTDAQDMICKAACNVEDSGAKFHEDTWQRGASGGGGRSRVLQKGKVFEKAGVNISVVYGELPTEAATVMLQRDFGSSIQNSGESRDEITAGMDTNGSLGHTKQSSSSKVRFYAAGLSLVMHPLNPMAPTVHMNYRMMQIFTDKEQNSGKEQSSSRDSRNIGTKENTGKGDGNLGKPLLWWFGGGLDLSPAYINVDDCTYFHRKLLEQCERCDWRYYPRFKRWCDAYFRNHHRNEGRGIGGIFFDNLNENMSSDPQKFFDFAKDGLQKTFPEAYFPLVEKHKDDEYTPEQKIWQQVRRGRYVEFNLIHDRGTKFGLLMPDSRIESILVSLPLTARWEYSFEPRENSEEEKALEVFIRPKDWLPINEKALEEFVIPDCKPTNKAY